MEARFEFEFLQAVRLSGKSHPVVPDKSARTDWTACLQHDLPNRDMGPGNVGATIDATEE